MHEAEQRKVVAQCKAEADVAEAKKRQSSRMTVNAHQTEAEVDLGVPSCRGAFTSLIRLVAISRCRESFLFRV